MDQEWMAVVIAAADWATDVMDQDEPQWAKNIEDLLCVIKAT